MDPLVLQVNEDFVVAQVLPDRRVHKVILAEQLAQQDRKATLVPQDHWD